MTVNTATELWRMGANELAATVRSRQASAREVVEAHLRRIAAIDLAVNATPVVLAEQALEAAMAADRAVSSGAPLHDLHGVPFVVKSNIDVLGTATTQGMKALENAFPSRDAPVVERMKAAGAIAIGRTNMPNGAIRWHCESELYGKTINPWDRSRTAGGSSAGAAAAIATGMSPLGLGNDGLGSLRHPAQCCGIVALKPTPGRVPDSSAVPGAEAGPIGAQLMVVNGPLARRVVDLKTIFGVIAGPTWRDPWSVPAPVQGPELLKPMRVAVVVDPVHRGTAAQVQNGVRKAARALEDAGYEVEEVEPPSIELAAKTCLDLYSTPDSRALVELMAPIMPADTMQFLKRFFEVAAESDRGTAGHAFVTRHRLMKAWGEFQEAYPLILGPICTEIPFKAGTDLTENRVAAEVQSMRMTTAVNALGLPAIAVPVGIEDGLPQAVQVIAPRYREDLCLDAAQALEDAFGILTPIDPRD